MLGLVGHPPGICQTPSYSFSAAFNSLHFFASCRVSPMRDQKRTICVMPCVCPSTIFTCWSENRVSKIRGQREQTPLVGRASRALLSAAAAWSELNVRAKVGGGRGTGPGHRWAGGALLGVATIAGAGASEPRHGLKSCLFSDVFLQKPL